MAAPGYGGETPIIKYGTEITVESPAGISAAAPINQGDLFILSGTAADGSGYKAAAATAGNAPTTVGCLLMALHRMEQPSQPMGVKVLNGSMEQIRRLRYTGSPTLGQSVAISAADVRKVVGKAFAVGDGRILAINTSTTEVEVLI